ncbi:MAG: acyl-CoA/acyl-ACP dehydrogenase [bacterium]|nr:acyl-CoA/acyl-ACP dehydrogenase [bacterium]
MQPDLTPREAEMVKRAREIARNDILPAAAERDRNFPPDEAYPWEILDKISAAGLRTLTVPQEFGGFGARHLVQAMVAEELAYGDLGVAVSLDQVYKFTRLLTDETTPRQREKYLDDFLGDPRALLALATTEPQSGTDTFLMYDAPRAGPRMTAKKEGGDFVLNGTKHYISNGGLAKYYFIFARTAPEKPMSEGLTCFLVPKGTTGFTIGEAHSKLGRRLLQNGELVFQDCRIPEENLFGDWDGGLSILRRMVSGALIPAMGPARLAYDLARQAAQETGAGSEQWVQMALTEMYMLIEAARTFLYSAAWHAEKPTDNSKRRLMSKVFASEAAIKVCRMAMDIWGKMGAVYHDGRPTPEKCWRDVLSYLHGFGTNEAVKLKAAPLLAPAGEDEW